MSRMVSKYQNVTKLNPKRIEEHTEQLIQKQQHKKGLYRRLTLLSVVFLLLVSSALITLFSQHTSMSAREDTIRLLEKDKRVVLEEEKHLLKEIENYQDDAFIAEIARRDYFLTFPGETRINVPKESDD
ncbi:cell division protein DivIC [Shouchella lonarensis]|uniref:Cell division protein DivIC n=2 Tax=Shouchella lonarensis TaxID=1464122 RepID=A0A1G6NU94_9BACI|nr:cell division protein DivIC [Shouchella lonarensis]